MYDQGGHVTVLDPSSSQIGHKESPADTARVLSRIFDGIEYRGSSQETVEELAQFADAMQPAGPFMLACSPVSATMKLQVKDMVNKVATGGLKALLSLIPGI